MNFEEMIFQPGPPRTIFLQSLLQRIYPDITGYWSSGEDLEGIERNCVEVCEWFGFSPNDEIVKGNSSREEQENFWRNVLLAVQDMEEQSEYNCENTEIPMFGQLKSLVLRSNVIIELIRFSDTLENIQPALHTLTSIISAASTEMERIRIVLHEITSKDMLFVCLTEQVNHEKRYRDLVTQTFNLVDSFMKLYFVALPKDACVKVRKAPQRHGYESRTMLSQTEEISRNIHKMIATIKGLKEVFLLVNKKIDNVAEFRPSTTF
jgi:hypothetical protein